MFEKFNKFMNTVREGLQYSIFEGLYLITLVIDKLLDGELTTWWVGVGAVLAIIWVVVTFTAEAKVEMKQLVLDREVFMTDFFVSAFLLSLIALTVQGEPMWMMGAILLATGQNLRYSYLSMQWLLEEKRERRRKEGHSDSDLP